MVVLARTRQEHSWMEAVGQPGCRRTIQAGAHGRGLGSLNRALHRATDRGRPGDGTPRCSDGSTQAVARWNFDAAMAYLPEDGDQPSRVRLRGEWRDARTARRRRRERV